MSKVAAAADPTPHIRRGCRAAESWICGGREQRWACPSLRGPASFASDRTKIDLRTFRPLSGDGRGFAQVEVPRHRDDPSSTFLGHQLIKGEVGRQVITDHKQLSR